MGDAGRVLYCHCARGNAVPTEVRRAVLERLSASGVAFDAVPDLCEMSARKDPALKRFAESGDVRIAACFPRAVRWLFHAGGAPLPAEGVEVLNMRARRVEDVISRLLAEVTPQEDRSLGTAPVGKLPGRSLRPALVRKRRGRAGVWNRAGQEAAGAVVGLNKLDRFNLRVVLLEESGGEPLGDDERFNLLVSLLDAGYEVTRLDNGYTVMSERSSTSLVLGRFNGREPPGVAGITAPGLGRGEAEAHVRDITGLDTDGVLAVVERAREESGARRLSHWTPWFPVIDYDRCTNCMQCLSFCLFDVFGAGEQGRILVDNPDRCKTNCPACARVCPEVAIVFPLCSMGPINGDEVHDEDLDREAMKVDVSALLGGDTRSSLGARSGAYKKRFSTERRGAPALLERRRWLEPNHDRKGAAQKIQGDPGVPDEIVQSLPAGSAAEEALERMQARSARRRARPPAADEWPEPPSEEEWGI